MSIVRSLSLVAVWSTITGCWLSDAEIQERLDAEQHTGLDEEDADDEE
jgi:hypothetical protein